MMKILFGFVIGIAVYHFGIVPIAQFVDRMFDATVLLVTGVSAGI
jgi:hypothetical protein